MGISLTDDFIRTAHEEWQAAGRGAKKATLEHYAELAGCSPDTLYRRFRARHGRQRTLADDAAQRETDYPEWIFDMCERMVVRSLKLGDRRLSAKVMRKKLRRRGVEEKLIPSESTINARLSDRGLSRGRRYRRVESQFALQLVQLDFSRSEYFQLQSHDGEHHILRVTDRHLSYKDNNKAQRSWIISLIDDHSRMTWARMYAAAGESGELGLRGLMDFFSLGDEEHIFHHAPWTIQTDYGAFYRNETVAVSLDACEIDLKAASKEAQGKVERQFRTLWSDFELDLAEELGRGATITMQEYNALLLAYCADQAQEVHPVWKNRSREEVYRVSIRKHPPRTFSGDLLQLAFRVKEPTIDRYGHVSIDGVELVVPEFASDDEGNHISLAPGMKIAVLPNLRGEYVGRLIGTYSEPFRLEPFDLPEYGDFAHGPTLSRIEHLRGMEVNESAEEAAARHVPGDYEPKEAAGEDETEPRPVIHTLPHRSSEIEAASPFLDVERGELMKPFEARVYIGRRLAAYDRTYAEFAYLIEPELTNGAITREDVEDIVAVIIREAV